MGLNNVLSADSNNQVDDNHNKGSYDYKEEDKSALPINAIIDIIGIIAGCALVVLGAAVIIRKRKMALNKDVNMERGMPTPYEQYRVQEVGYSTTTNSDP